jgi:hypothetical protein
MPDMSKASLPIIDVSGGIIRFFDQPLAYKMGLDKALSACNRCITASSRVSAGDG